MENINFGFVPTEFDGTEHIIKGGAYETLPIPEEFSYEEIMAPILNQGAESTCVPHSVSSFYDYYYAMDNATERDRDGHMLNTGMSIHQIYDCRTNQGDGMTYKEALAFCKNHGVTSEYNYRKGRSEENLITISEYGLIPNMEIMKRSILMNGPALIATYVRDINRADFWNGKYMYGGHATSLIGYSDKQKAFRLRNSWGTQWGDNGYTWLPYSDYNKILEAWGIIG